LKERGLHGGKLVTSDAHSDLKNAPQSVLSGVAWQRCQVHHQRHAAPYVPMADLREGVAADIRSVFKAPPLKEAERLLSKHVEESQGTAGRLAVWMEDHTALSIVWLALSGCDRRGTHDPAGGGRFQT